MEDLGVLIDRLNPPPDWSCPKWDVEDRVHNWRNYAEQDLVSIWGDFSDVQKVVISSSLEEAAGRERWE